MSDVTPIPNKPVNTYRLLHTADWHLGKTLNDRSREEEHRRFLEWLLTQVNAHGVDAIVLAGDVFDSAYPSQSAQKLYYDFISQLQRFEGCRLAVIAGNHDSPAHLEAPALPLRFLKTFVTGALPEKAEDRVLLLPDKKSPKVALAMVPYLTERYLRQGKAGETNEQIRRQLAEGIRARYSETAEAMARLHPGVPAVALGHLTVLGSRTSDSERDIHIGGLGAVRPACFDPSFTYVALGHLHRPQAVKGDDRVRYAGSPIALSFSEATDEKEVRIVDVRPDGITDHGLPIPVFRRLAQLKTESARAETTVENFDPGKSELTPWVEVVVKDAVLNTDLNDRLRALDLQGAFEVVTVLRAGSIVAVQPMETLIESSDESDPLDEPKAIFERVMEQYEELAAKEKPALRRSFQSLLERDAEAEV